MIMFTLNQSLVCLHENCKKNSHITNVHLCLGLFYVIDQGNNWELEGNLFLNSSTLQCNTYCMHAFYQVIQYFLEPSLTPTAAKNISAESLQIKENATHFFPGQFLLNQIL